MFIVLLRFSNNRPAAADHMAGHQAWIDDGVAAGVFVLVGSIGPGQGGAIIATATTEHEIRARVAADPFVVHDVVTAEVLKIDPNTADPRLAFLTA